MNALPVQSRLALLAVAVLATASCEDLSRSSRRKLAAYPPQRLATLDLRLVRVAFQHDSRVELNQAETYVKIFAGAVSDFREASNFPPLLIRSAPLAPGLPDAARGMTWTVIGFRAVDVLQAESVNGLYWRWVLRDLKRPKGATVSEEEGAANKLELYRVFPNLELIVRPEALAGFRYTTSFDFTDSPAVAKDRFPLEIWLLLDPADGFVQLFEGRVNLHAK